MYIAIINWSAGENDPFSFFAEQLGRMFRGLGREVIFLHLNDDFASQINELKNLRIDFALTFQGLGSDLRIRSTNQNLWDALNIPLHCLQGDHPSLMLDNHKALARNVVHHYMAPSFNHYANRYIPRRRAATAIVMPLFFPDISRMPIEGDFFVLPKNHDDTEQLRAAYASTGQAEIRSCLLTCADLIDESLRTQSATDHHSIIDDVIYESPALADTLEAAGEEAIYIIHKVHGLLEKFYRNRLAELALDELADCPMQIYGRGWERFHGRHAKHRFLAFDKTRDGSFQYRSRYGIVDVAPSFDSLHDRTLRALSSRSSVLIGSSWPMAENFPDARDSVFYDGRPGNLREKAEAVLMNPEMHRERCAAFSQQYRLWASDHQFLRVFESVTFQLRETARQPDELFES